MTTIPAGTYAIDPTHSEIGFAVRHVGIAKVRGYFEDFSGTVTVSENFPESSATVTVKMASVNTRNEQRDAHLRGTDFFDVEKNPEMSFTSTGIRGEGDEFVLLGDLTINGVTQAIEIEAEYNGTATDPFGNERIGFTGETEINRKDFGLTWNAALETGGVLVSEKVQIVLEVSATKQV